MLFIFLFVHFYVCFHSESNACFLTVFIFSLVEYFDFFPHFIMTNLCPKAFFSSTFCCCVHMSYLILLCKWMWELFASVCVRDRLCNICSYFYSVNIYGWLSKTLYYISTHDFLCVREKIKASCHHHFVLLCFDIFICSYN